MKSNDEFKSVPYKIHSFFPKQSIFLVNFLMKYIFHSIKYIYHEKLIVYDILIHN